MNLIFSIVLSASGATLLTAAIHGVWAWSTSRRPAVHLENIKLGLETLKLTRDSDLIGPIDAFIKLEVRKLARRNRTAVPWFRLTHLGWRMVIVVIATALTLLLLSTWIPIQPIWNVGQVLYLVTVAGVWAVLFEIASAIVVVRRDGVSWRTHRTSEPKT